MVDIVSPEKRSKMMAGIRGKDTKPELLIRKALHKRGFSYRLHDKKLPGKPDIVLSRYKAVIQVNGCFWHGHNCHLFKWPSTRPDFWQDKIKRNKENDIKSLKALSDMEWRILTIWECAIKGRASKPFEIVLNSVISWLISSEKNKEITGKEVD
ncbi:DNA mismatch endonuclease Vsr [Caldithrix abyssi]|nr:DNA mismatch endonuclease Vsr [Caldithrix abyssi]